MRLLESDEFCLLMDLLDEAESCAEYRLSHERMKLEYSDARIDEARGKLDLVIRCKSSIASINRRAAKEEK